ncbi:MAG: hydrogenase maturation protease [Rhodothermales bacterium]
MMNTLILGIGNLLMGDEGVGIHVVRRLEESAPMHNVDIVDGGTGGFHLLGFFQNYERVILVDATMDEHPLGTIRRVHPKFLNDYPPTLTAHEIGLRDLLEALYMLDTQPPIVLFTITIGAFSEMSLELSPEVLAAVPKAAQAVVNYLESTV